MAEAARRSKKQGSTVNEDSARIVHFIRQRLRISKDDIEIVAVVGSRLWGLARHRHSDWDMFIVLKGSRDRTCVSLAQKIGPPVDVVVIGTAEFLQQQREGEFLSLVVAMLPSTHPCMIQCCKTRVSIPPNPQILYASLLERVKKDRVKSAKFFKKGKAHEARKIMCHATRVALLTLQIIETGRITHPEEGRSEFAALLVDPGVSDLPQTVADCESRTGDLLADTLAQVGKLVAQSGKRQRVRKT